METNKIYNMDCIEGIKKIPDCSIDTIITDPPYFQGLTHNGQKAEFTDLSISGYFFAELFRQMKRVLKKEGCIYFFTDWRGYAFYYPRFDEAIGATNMLVWDKGSGPGNHYGYAHELVLFHSGKTIKNAGCNVIKGISGFASGAKKTNGEKVHPTQKPVEIIKKFITDSTKQDGIVLDCFLGSGTTPVAALETGRNYIGFEIAEKYFNIAKKRIAETEEVFAYTE